MGVGLAPGGRSAPAACPLQWAGRLAGRGRLRLHAPPGGGCPQWPASPRSAASLAQNLRVGGRPGPWSAHQSSFLQPLARAGPDQLQ